VTGPEGDEPLPATTRTARIDRVAGVIAAGVGGSPDECQAAAVAVVEYLERRTPSTVESPRDGIARVLGGEGDLLSHADRAALEDAADRIVDYYGAIGSPIEGVDRRHQDRRRPG
jgi:hypothetical protein